MRPHRLQENADGLPFDSGGQDTPCRHRGVKQFARSAKCAGGKTLPLWRAVPGCPVECSGHIDIAPRTSWSCPSLPCKPRKCRQFRTSRWQRAEVQKPHRSFVPSHWTSLDQPAASKYATWRLGFPLRIPAKTAVRRACDHTWKTRRAVPCGWPRIALEPPQNPIARFAGAFPHRPFASPYKPSLAETENGWNALLPTMLRAVFST